ncbi:MAG: N-glycosylase [Candidatus Thermoplasmatota archaeon]|nr:N-glycosylase [Candidatus Thermoplasmatota archaeon]
MDILDQVDELRRSSFRKLVEAKQKEFISAGMSTKEFIFGELCFCILTANTSAELGLAIQSRISPEQFSTLPAAELRNALRAHRYRFYNTRSAFISKNRWIMDDLPGILRWQNRDEAREYLVEKLYGIGYKEASHFLRNTGIFDFAILDKHILRILSDDLGINTGIFDFAILDKHILRILSDDLGIDTGKISQKNRYKIIEERFIDIAKSFDMSPGIFDLYLWKIATGKLLK